MIDADAWWEATRDRRLLLQRCLDCRRFQHYPRPLCTSCGGDRLDFVEAAGTGTIDSFTIAEQHTLARVRLDEGPILLTHLDGIDDPSCDQSVRLAWQALPDGRHLPVFRSADNGL